MLATGSGPPSKGDDGSSPYFVASQSALSTLATAGAPDDSLSNVRRNGQASEAADAGSSVFVGTSGNLSLLDGFPGGPSASASFGYTMAPTTLGAAAGAAPVAAEADDTGTGAAPPPLTHAVGTTVMLSNPYLATDAPADASRGATKAKTGSVGSGSLGYIYAPLGRGGLDIACGDRSRE